MVIEMNFKKYQESIGTELKTAQDRIRNLIGSNHWLTDGEHKEAILRQAFRNHLPENIKVGRGFVCFPDKGDSSSQLDILLADRNQPCLYKDSDLMIITSSAAKGLVEVKTNLHSKTTARKALSKLSRDAKIIRQSSKKCPVGLFVYNEENIGVEVLMDLLFEICNEEDKVVNYVSYGSRHFIRFWNDGSEIDSPVGSGPVWHRYDLRNLASSYFIANFVFDCSLNIPESEQIAWFPYPGGKERKKMEAKRAKFNHKT